MLLQEFERRRAECIALARRTPEAHDRELFRLLADAFAGRREDEAEPRPQRSATPH